MSLVRNHTVSLTIAKFLDVLVKNAEAGGQEAAQLLRSRVLDYLRHKLPELQHDLEIVIRVYGNMNGLNKRYCDSNVLEQREDFGRFVRGFNMGHPLCDFIDAGNGKECSDDKIRGESEIKRPADHLVAHANINRGL